MTTPPQVIQEIFPESRGASDAFIRHGMSPTELHTLGGLIRHEKPLRILEIGMANGTSSVVIADAMGAGHLTSIDPHQSMPEPVGYGAAGLRAVERLTTNHRLIEEYDYLALPRLISEGASFEFILVDGFHSFDLTLLDLFYADILLDVGGLLLCHDSSSPAVYKALRWLEANKPYERLSPPLYTGGAPAWVKL
jgi:predicted O-methyltransferase YrrM